MNYFKDEIIQTVNFTLIQYLDKGVRNIFSCKLRGFHRK
jgi:hypothetical protein